MADENRLDDRRKLDKDGLSSRNVKPIIHKEVYVRHMRLFRSTIYIED